MPQKIGKMKKTRQARRSTHCRPLLRVKAFTSTKGRVMDKSMIDNQQDRMSAQYKTEVPNEIIESQTKKIPNLLFLGLGLASMGSSLFLTMKNRTTLGNFVGQWVPTLLIFGLYNKVVKLEDEILKSKLH
jgi:hypothetical protein